MMKCQACGGTGGSPWHLKWRLIPSRSVCPLCQGFGQIADPSQRHEKPTGTILRSVFACEPLRDESFRSAEPSSLANDPAVAATVALATGNRAFDIIEGLVVGRSEHPQVFDA